MNTTYRAGADLWLLLVAVVALIGYVVLVVTGNGHDDRLLGLVTAAVAAGAGVAAPRGITRAIDAVTSLNTTLTQNTLPAAPPAAPAPAVTSADPVNSTLTPNPPAAAPPVIPSQPAVPPFLDQP